MKPRVRPISNLYFRWGKKLELDAEDVATALERAGFIERVGAELYSEIKRDVKLPDDEFNDLILTTLINYKGQTYG